MFRSTLAIVYLLSAVEVNALNGFKDSCWDFRTEETYYRDAVLSGNCAPSYNGRVGINLNSCFVNRGGLVGFQQKYACFPNRWDLLTRPSGNFYQSCKNLESSSNDPIIHVNCTNGRDQWFRNEINLNDWIGNINGQLAC